MLAWTTARALAVTVGGGLVSLMPCRVASSQSRTTLSPVAEVRPPLEAATGVRTATRVARESSTISPAVAARPAGRRLRIVAPWVVVADVTRDSERGGWRIAWRCRGLDARNDPVTAWDAAGSAAATNP